MQYDAFDLFDYGDVPPQSLLFLASPLEVLAPLQHNVENDVSDDGNALVGVVYKRLGATVGREERSSVLFFVMLVVVVVVDVVVDGGCVGGCRIVKSYKL